MPSRPRGHPDFFFVAVKGPAFARLVDLPTPFTPRKTIVYTCQVNLYERPTRCKPELKVLLQINAGLFGLGFRLLEDCDTEVAGPVAGARFPATGLHQHAGSTRPAFFAASAARNWTRGISTRQNLSDKINIDQLSSKNLRVGRVPHHIDRLLRRQECFHGLLNCRVTSNETQTKTTNDLIRST